jgi:O-antigen ligase
MTPASVALLGLTGAACVAALRWPLIGLAIYLAWDFVRPHDMDVALRVFRPMLMLGTVTFIATARLRWGELLRADRRLLPLVVLLAATTASTIASINPRLSVEGLVHAAKMLVLVWMLASLAGDGRRVRLLFWVIGGSLCVLAVSAVVQAVDHGLRQEFRYAAVIRGPAGAGRGDGMLRDSNDVARVLALAVPLWVVLIAADRRWWCRAIAAIGLLLCIAGTVCTYSRGGFLALVAGVAALASPIRPRGRGIALVVAFVAALLALAPRTYRERILSLSAAPTDAAITNRFDVWSDGLRMVFDSPLFGRGPQTFSSDGVRYVRRASHNVFVEVAAELGLIGLAAYVWALGSAAIVLHRVYHSGQPGEWPAIAGLGVAAALAAYLTAGLAVGAPMLSPLFVLIGLALALDRKGVKRET